MARVISGKSALSYLPSFRVSVNTTYDHTGGNFIQFDKDSGDDMFNLGGHYSTSTYKFVAPVSGTYSFQTLIIFEQVSDNTDMTDSLRINVNGIDRSFSWRRAKYRADYTGTSGYFTDFSADTFKLSAGDEVAVAGEKSARVHNNPQYCYFSGSLVG